jgi:hypothetical protein
MRVDAAMDGNGGGYASVGVAPCQTDPPISLVGYTFSMYIYISGPALGPYAQLEVQYMTPGGTGDNYLLLSVSQLTTGTWLPASVLFVTTDQASVLYLHLDSGSDSPWAGTIYIDDVQLFK